MTKHKPRQPKKFDIYRTLPSSSYPNRASVNPPRPEVIEIGTSRPHKKKGFRWKKFFLSTVLVALIPVLIIGIWDYRNFARASEKLFGTSSALGLFLPSELDSTIDERTNILLVGYSADDPGHAGATLTDSIMILSLDKDDKTGYMLSIPRDLYVSIPGNGRAKINEAYQNGENQGFEEAGYPKGGIGLLEKIITEEFGIQIHYYALINYAAVRDTVDALGGITVNIQSPDPRGIYDPNFRPFEGGPLKLENGTHKIDEQTALRLTRARGATYGSYGFPQSDFNRTQNQQMVLAAIKKELDWTLVLNPRTNGKIFEAVANNVKTDVELSEVLPLYRLNNRVPNDQMRTISLLELNGKNLLKSYATPSGQSALIPSAGIDDFEDIRKAIQSIQ